MHFNFNSNTVSLNIRYIHATMPDFHPMLILGKSFCVDVFRTTDAEASRPKFGPLTVRSLRFTHTVTDTQSNIPRIIGGSGRLYSSPDSALNRNPATLTDHPSFHNFNH